MKLGIQPVFSKYRWRKKERKGGREGERGEGRRKGKEMTNLSSIEAATWNGLYLVCAGFPNVGSRRGLSQARYQCPSQSRTDGQRTAFLHPTSRPQSPAGAQSPRPAGFEKYIQAIALPGLKLCP